MKKWEKLKHKFIYVYYKISTNRIKLKRFKDSLFATIIDCLLSTWSLFSGNNDRYDVIICRWPSPRRQIT